LSVINGLDEDEQLPPHPKALLGTLIHGVMDRLRRSSFDSAEAAVSEAKAVFDSMLETLERRLGTQLTTRSLVPLQRAVGLTAWRDRAALLKRWATALASTPDRSRDSVIPTKHQSEESNILRTYTPTRVVPVGTERTLVVPDLRLSGRPDLIERKADGSVHVTDLKTGPILNKGGQLDEKYVLQVRLYALMIESLEPDAKVVPWLEQSQRFTVLWDDEVRDTTMLALAEILEYLPENKSLHATSLAKEGPQCLYCRIRHRCPVYLNVAPSWWGRMSVLGPVAPFDVWGKVVNVVSRDSDTIGIEIIDAAGRRVLIRGLESTMESELAPGAEIWFFNLEASEMLPLHGTFIHPHNFHGRAPSRAWANALRLVTYIGRSDALKM
jgi:RecB family exonuclease